MAYKSEVYIKARAALDERRRKAEREQQARRAEAEKKCPTLAAVEREMASYGAEAIRLVGKGVDVDKEIAKLAEKSREIQAARRAILVEAGFHEDYLDVKYHCPVCNDTGSHDGYYCDCYRKLVVETARKELCSLSLLDASSFENFSLDYYSDEIDDEIGISPRSQMEDALETCRRFAENFKPGIRGIFISGMTGLGKTHLSLAIADTVTKKGYNVCYTSAQNAVHKLEREHFRRDEEQTNLLDELCTADLLVIDDLGAEFSTGFTVSQIYNIINTRIVDGRPTVISTNLTFTEIESKYSQRVLSRIVGSFEIVRCFGTDIRMKKLGE